MNTLKYPSSNAKAKAGINHVRNIIESSNSIFTEIPQQNDLGVDAIIELIFDEQPTSKSFGVQIKSGESFYDETNNECHIPVEQHFNYWLNYPLPVYGIVYVPSKVEGYWVNIKEYLKEHGKVSLIKFRCSKVNKFDFENFNTILLPHLIDRIPTLTLEEALTLFGSDDYDEFCIGTVVLFRTYSNHNIVWERFITYFKQTAIEEVPNIALLIQYLSQVPGNPDLWGGINDGDSRKYAQHLICSFEKAEIIKLLEIINPEDGIARGTIGQSVEIIISSIPKAALYLNEICEDEYLPELIRMYASAILDYQNRKIDFYL